MKEPKVTSSTRNSNSGRTVVVFVIRIDILHIVRERGSWDGLCQGRIFSAHAGLISTDDLYVGNRCNERPYV